MPPGITPIKKDSLEKAAKDSAALAVASQKKYEHIFTGHLLRPKNSEAIPYQDPTPVWPAFVFLLPVALLVYLRVKYYKKILPVFRSFFTLQAARQLEREDYRLTRGLSVILSFVFLVSFSFFLFQYNNHFPVVKMKWEPIIQFHIIFAGLLLMYLVKFTANRVFGFIMDAPNEVYEYNFNVFLCNQGIGFFLLPIAICLQYLRFNVVPMLIAGFVIVLGFYLIRLGKGIVIGLGSRTLSAFHLFLYLCALEILPLIVLFTFLVRLNK
ncbi:MAG: DUF4271 domain-containing protein [Bacteroidia bacterium]|nr:DUF4271 domain-containing protein [Bacteroidia bacterium]